MATYLETQQRIADEINRDDLTSNIRQEILSAIEYYKQRRFWWNETTATTTTVASTNYVSLPSDFVDLDIIQITVGSNTTVLDQVLYSDIVKWDINGQTGQPTSYALYQDRVRLYPTPNSTYTITFHYVKALTALSADADTNAWLTDGEELIRLHAKKLLYANKIRNAKAAQDMAALEELTLLRLESRNQRRVTTGRLKASYL